MAFDVPAPLLAALRARRKEQRRRRALAAPSAAPGDNFLGVLGNIFNRGAPADAGALYANSMDAWQDEVERAHDAFLLDPGMGPMAYLTADGRVLWDERGWDGDGVVEVTGRDARAALVVGARKTGLAALLTLLPAAPAGAVVCPTCKGTCLAALAPGIAGEFPCRACACCGWVAAEV
jgi:hypothetical protein